MQPEMKRKRFREEEIVWMLRERGAGMAIDDLFGKH
jgi:hypothetical protein